MLALLAMIGPFAIDTFFPAFPAIAQALQASPFEMQQTLSVYLMAYALMSLLHGGLSDALGRRPVILAALLVFTLASIGCALTDTMQHLLWFRAVQGLSAGAGVIVGRAIVRDCFEGARAQRVMSGVSMLFGVAPAIAPIVGGYLLVFGWRASFWFLALFSAALLAACWRLLPESLPAEKRTPLHPWSLARGYAHMLRNHRFVLLGFAGGFNFSAIFLYISSAPAFVLDILGMNERQFAAFFVPTISGMVLGAYLSGRMAGKVQSRTAIPIAYGVMLLAAVINIGYTQWTQPVHWPMAVLPVAMIAVAVAIAFPLLSLAMMDVFPDRRGAASSLQMFLSLVVNAAVSGLLAPLVQSDARSLALAASSLTLSGLVLYLLARKAIPLDPRAQAAQR